MARKDFTLSSKILMSLALAADTLIVTPRELRRRAWMGKPLGDGKSFYQIVRYLEQKGLIRFVNRDNERFLKLTKKGELEALIAKARIAPKIRTWDGKWRIIMFDIPEESSPKRKMFRWLLKRHNFTKLQHSVYVSPYPLNREAIEFLKATKLIQYIRILKVEEMDDDKDLKKRFGLKV